MKVRLTEEQLQNIIKQPINENYINSSPEGIQLANQLFNDPNNRTLWRCFGSDKEKSIFEHGMTSEYHDTGEGHYHGYGLYCFYEPYGCQKRVGTGGVGDKIMKGVLKNKFRDFLIFDGEVAMKYYNSDDIRDQLNYLYKDKEFVNEVATIYRDGAWCRSRYGNGKQFYHGKGDFKLHFHHNTAYLSKLLWETFGLKLQGGKCRGIVYNGDQDPHACLIFNPREFIPICVTKERRLNASGRDFDNWEIKVTQNLLNRIETIKDYFSIGEKLKANGEIKSYTQLAPLFGFLRVTLNNGKTSYYDIKTKNFVSKYGFDMTFGFSKNNSGTIYSPCVLNLNGKAFEFFIVPQDGKYYVCKMNKQTGNFDVIPQLATTEKYDIVIPRELAKRKTTVQKEPEQKEGEQQINEDYHPGFGDSKIEDFRKITGLHCRVESIYHRTGTLESCEGISQYGFSSQYSKCECYGHGIYAALTPRDSTNHLRGYGNFMIHAYLKEGFKNFVIFEPGLARKYYGEHWRVADQLKLLIRPEYYKELMSRHRNLEYDQNIISTLDRELGMTNIRGSIVDYGGCYITVICDWKSAIPYEYSTDNGYTWKKTLGKDNFNYIDEHRDGLFLIQKFVADGIVKDTFGLSGYRGDWRTNIKLHPQFVNGYLRVTLANGKISFLSAEDNDLITYAGLDTAINWGKDNVGDPCLDCIIMNKVCRVYKVGGKYWVCKKNIDGGYDPKFTLKMYDNKILKK